MGRGERGSGSYFKKKSVPGGASNGPPLSPIVDSFFIIPDSPPELNVLRDPALKRDLPLAKGGERLLPKVPGLGFAGTDGRGSDPLRRKSSMFMVPYK